MREILCPNFIFVEITHFYQSTSWFSTARKTPNALNFKEYIRSANTNCRPSIIHFDWHTDISFKNSVKKPSSFNCLRSLIRSPMVLPVPAFKWTRCVCPSTRTYPCNKGYKNLNKETHSSQLIVWGATELVEHPNRSCRGEKIKKDDCLLCGAYIRV